MDRAIPPRQRVAGSESGPLRRYEALIEDGEVRPDPDQRSAIVALQKLHETLVDYPELGTRTLDIRKWRIWNLLGGGPKTGPRGLYMWGGVGRGKSMIMDLFFVGAPINAKRRTHLHAFMQEVHAAIHAFRKMDPSERIRYGAAAGDDDPIPAVARAFSLQATLLCFDEFHVTDVADAMILGRLFEELFDRGVIVVATSNRPPEDLYKDGLNRQLFLPFIDMLTDTLDVVPLNGPVDYRLARLKSVDSYYHVPNGDEATARLREAFFRLTDRSVDDADKVPTGELIVQGRTIFVPKDCKGVAVFSFKRLCEEPLGPADYLAIAQRYHTLIIVGIPIMGPDKRNAAKRFVTLIDALYEQNCKLLCAADGAPTDLYVAGDGAFEFDRTVSRLIEMQSEHYLRLGHGSAKAA
ncbi:MAG: cell division protein ZapE [Pseudomonadota bacterium]